MDDFQVDILVVGAGNAAACAALAAREKGATVAMLEAAPEEERGGNSTYTAGAMRVVFNGVKDLVQLIECDPDSVIGQTILWKIVRSYAFGSVSGSDLAPPFRSHSVVLFLHFQVVELRTEIA